MKIFFISHWGWGLYKSRAEMAKKIKNSFTVNAICPKDEFYKKIIDTYDEFFEWNVNRTESNIRQILSTYNLSKIIKKNQEKNLFHVFTLKSSVLFALTAFLFLRKKRINAIASITGLGYFFGDTLIAKSARTLFRYPLIIIFRNTYKYFVFQNPGDVERLRKYLKIDKNSLKIIEGSGINISSMTTKKVFSTKNIKVIMATRLLREKGIEEYIRIANKVKSKDGSINFFLAGEIDPGNPSSISADQLLQIENNDNINYLGNIENLDTELHKFDIAVLTSYHEGFSRFLLESSYVGLFCLSNYLAGTKAILENELNGKLIHDNDTEKFCHEILNFTKQKVVDENKVEEQRRLIEKNFSLEHVSTEFYNLYNKIQVNE